jgi:hypothetical protein
VEDTATTVVVEIVFVRAGETETKTLAPDAVLFKDPFSGSVIDYYAPAIAAGFRTFPREAFEFIKKLIL